MLLGAKVRALASGRPSVAREDVLAFAVPAMRHRLVLNFEATADRVAPDRVAGDVVASVGGG